MKRKLKLAAYITLTIAAACALAAWAGICIYNACEADPSLVPGLELAGQWFFAGAAVLLCGAVILAGWGAQAARRDEKSNT